MSSGKLVTRTPSGVTPRTTRKASLVEMVKVIYLTGRQRASTPRRARMRIYPEKARSPRKCETVCKQPGETSPSGTFKLRSKSQHLYSSHKHTRMNVDRRPSYCARRKPGVSCIDSRVRWPGLTRVSKSPEVDSLVL